MKILTPEEHRSLHHRYKQSDLYRQWSPILSMLQRNCGEMDATEIWFLAEKQIARLREEPLYREQEISPIYNELIDECKILTTKDLKIIQRSDSETQRSAITVMCVVLTMLMNAVEKGYETESFDNEPMCMAIMDILAQDAFFQQLMKVFFDRNTGYDGKKVVITPSDPMANNDPMINMDEIAKEETTAKLKLVLNQTNGLKVHLNKNGKDDWSKWESVWNDICADTELMMLLKVKNSPRGSEWEINEKMVFNVLGIFITALGYKNIVSTACKAITSKGGRRDYATNHSYKSGNSTVLGTQDIHDKVQSIVNKYCKKQ